MARRRASRRRSSSAGGSGAGLTILAGVIGALVMLGVNLAIAGGRWYVRTWKQSGRNGRVLLGGGLAVMLITICGLGAGSSSSSSRGAQSFAPAAAAIRAATEPTAMTAPPSATPLPSPTDMPTAPPATEAPTATPQPPAGGVSKSGNLRTEPRIATETVIGSVCAGDTVAFLSQQQVDEAWWYLVRVVARGDSCGAAAVDVGAEGWASEQLLTEPSYAVTEYALAARITLPTAIVAPTSTARPTARPRPTAEPQRLAPSGGTVRIGAICRDGTRSSATGRGACSHHGGVAQWLYR